MNKSIILLMVLLLLLTGCNYNTELSSEAKTEILETVEKYYSSLEQKEYYLALSHLYLNNNGVIKEFEFKNRSSALNEINKLVGYEVRLLDSVSEISENFTSVKGEKPDKTHWVVSCDVSISLNDTKFIVNEELYIKFDGKDWRINKISSGDKYVI